MFDNLLGEFIGTMVLIVFGAGVCACNTLTKSKGQNGGWICITAGWGFAVTLGVYTATTLGAPQGDLNPAVTLGKTMIGIYSSSVLRHVHRSDPGRYPRRSYRLAGLPAPLG